MYDQFTTELNLELKPQANDIEISSDVIDSVISSPVQIL
jgi:hypothetical protein